MAAIFFQPRRRFIKVDFIGCNRRHYVRNGSALGGRLLRSFLVEIEWLDNSFEPLSTERPITLCDHRPDQSLHRCRNRARRMLQRWCNVFIKNRFVLSLIFFCMEFFVFKFSPPYFFVLRSFEDEKKKKNWIIDIRRSIFTTLFRLVSEILLRIFMIMKL